MKYSSFSPKLKNTYFKASNIFIFFGFILLVLNILFGITYKNNPQKEDPLQVENINALIYVDIRGAVINPGVYGFELGSRLEDAIKKSGGYKKDANLTIVDQSLNMASMLSDQQKIYIPYKGSSTNFTQSNSLLSVNNTNGGSVGTTQNRIIQINTASQSELDSLNGIGEITSKKIIANRPFQSIDDLVFKKIISKSTFNKIKSNISL